tara:strand:+ start:7949 stop:8197 length:249 start_codon:yes stop_codon:yes gene_type:complete
VQTQAHCQQNLDEIDEKHRIYLLKLGKRQTVVFNIRQTILDHPTHYIAVFVAHGEHSNMLANVRQQIVNEYITWIQYEGLPW